MQIFSLWVEDGHKVYELYTSATGFYICLLLARGIAMFASWLRQVSTQPPLLRSRGRYFTFYPYPWGGGMPAKAWGGKKMTVPAEYMRVKIKFKK